MPKYAIHPARVILLAGVEVTPEDAIATIECELPVHDVLALVQFRNATLVELELAEEGQLDANEEGDEHEESEDVKSPFETYSAKTQDALAKAGLTTLAQAAIWLRDNKDFTNLGIAKGVAGELVKQIEAAGIPTE
jgi:hypothetical protein